MVKVVLIDKNGTISTSNVNNINEETLYKKCNLRNDKDFSKRTEWSYKKNNNDYVIRLYAKDNGRANSENKYDLPPPVDETLYFGKLLLACYDKNNNTYVDFTKEEWEAKYEKLFGGFENLDEEDSYSEEEEIPEHLQTKEGYSKEDGFVVDDDSDDEEYIPSDEKDDSEESDSFDYSGEEETGEEDTDEEETDDESDDESDDDIEEILESDIEGDNSELEEEEYDD